MGEEVARRSGSRFLGKHVLITGGNTGIGRAVALSFASEGAAVSICWIDKETDANSLVEQISNLGCSVISIRADVAVESDVVDLFSQSETRLGPIDILVSNAGIQQPKSIIELELEDWDRMMAVHLRGNFLCCREAARRMIPRKCGHIITVCSQLGYIGRENYTAYSCAKGGVIAFTRALAKELAHQGILVNGVSPGLVDTGFDPLPEVAKEQHAASLPLKRLGTPEDMTAAFLFLASPEAAYFCGQILHPNGGEIMP